MADPDKRVEVGRITITRFVDTDDTYVRTKAVDENGKPLLDYDYYAMICMSIIDRLLNEIRADLAEEPDDGEDQDPEQ